MENAHTISAFCAKIAHIQGEIELYYKAIKGLEIKANTLKQSLLIFDENFGLHSIKAIRHRNALFKPREFKGLVIDILKQRQSVNLNELTALIAKAKSLDTKIVKSKVQRTIRSLIKSGSIVVLNSNACEPILSLNLGLFNETLAG